MSKRVLARLFGGHQRRRDKVMATLQLRQAQRGFADGRVLNVTRKASKNRNLRVNVAELW